MSLNVFKSIEYIQGSRVIIMDELKVKHPGLFDESGGMDYAIFEKEVRPKYGIYIRNDVNSISFALKRQPGGPGCQVGALIRAA